MSDLKTVPIGEKTFSIGTLPVLTQFHVSRRLTPFLPALAPHLSIFADKSISLEAKLLRAVLAVANVLSRMSDKKAEYIVLRCLSVVSLKQETGWAKVLNPSGGFMFPLDLKTMLHLTGEVVVANLGDFFPTGSLEESDPES